MRTNTFGTKIPDTELEFWELYHNFEITFVQMLDPNGYPIEMPTYDVVTKLMVGYNLTKQMQGFHNVQA